MQEAAVAWHVYMLTDSAWALGAIGLFRLVPIVVLLVAGGVLADSVDRRRLLLASQATMGIAALALGIATLGGLQSVLAIYAVTAVASAAAAFDAPARKALIPRLVSATALPSALSLADVAKNAAKLLGPALMGVLAAYADIGWVYTLNGLSYILVLGALLSIDPARTAVDGEPPASPAEVLQALKAGAEWLRGAPVVWGLSVLDALATFFASALILLPIWANDILHVDAAGYGLLASAAAAGALIAGGVLTATEPPRRPGTSAVGAVVVYGVATALFGLSQSFWACFAALMLVGAMDTVSTVLRNTVRQLATPDELRGRVTAFTLLLSKSGPRLGELEAGVAAAVLGAPASVVLGGVCCVGSALWVAWRWPQLRQWELPPATPMEPQPGVRG